MQRITVYEAFDKYEFILLNTQRAIQKTIKKVFNTTEYLDYLYQTNLMILIIQTLRKKNLNLTEACKMIGLRENRLNEFFEGGAGSWFNYNEKSKLFAYIQNNFDENELRKI